MLQITIKIFGRLVDMARTLIFIFFYFFLFTLIKVDSLHIHCVHNVDAYILYKFLPALAKVSEAQLYSGLTLYPGLPDGELSLLFACIWYRFVL